MDRLHVDIVSAADAGDPISRFDELAPFACPPLLPPAPAAFDRLSLGGPLRRRRPSSLFVLEWVLWSPSSLSSLRSLLPLAAGFFAQSSSPLLLCFTIFPTTDNRRASQLDKVLERVVLCGF